LNAGIFSDDNNPAVSYKSWSGLTLAYASEGHLLKAGASVRFTINGPQFTWLTTRCSLCGQAEVYVAEGECFEPRLGIHVTAYFQTAEAGRHPASLVQCA